MKLNQEAGGTGQTKGKQQIKQGKANHRGKIAQQ